MAPPVLPPSTAASLPGSRSGLSPHARLKGELEQVAHVVLALLVHEVLRLPEARALVLGVDDPALRHHDLLALHH